MRRLNGIAVLILGSVFSGSTLAESVDFVRDVRPIFEKHCYDCHGPQQQKSGLRLDVKASAFKGGDAYAPNIIVGKAKDSPLIQFVNGKDPDSLMPPRKSGRKSLSSAEIATLTAWVDQGATWPDGVDLRTLKDKREHWSFKSIARPSPPEPKQKSWPRNDIDRFILARLEKENLQPAPEAERVAWLRRVYFDLIGLPPSPEQAAAFTKDARADAFERVVDELLKSPRYGERWAQHWLDVVRYADTHGFEVNTERKNAWPYRDYVIAAFNDDTPYDRFVVEQIAGDRTGKDAATGFLVTASVLLPGQIGQDEPSKRLARQDSLDEIVTNTAQTFLGLSVGCARCHDHKFDPISQRDYYSMQAFFAGVEYDDRELHTHGSEALRQEANSLKQQLAQIEIDRARLVPLANANFQRPPVNPRLNVDRFAAVKTRRLRFTIGATNDLEPCIDELEVFDASGQNVALAKVGTSVTASGSTVVADRHELRQINDGNYGNSRSWMSNENGRGWVEFAFAKEQTIDCVIWGRDREGQFDDRLAIEYRIDVADHSGKWKTVADSKDRKKYFRGERAFELSTAGLSEDAAKKSRQLSAVGKSLAAKLAAIESRLTVFAGKFRTPDEIYLLNRGDPEQPKERIEPAVLCALDTMKLSPTAAEQDRRAALAAWIASPKNPLTARVIVNRIWQGHFGVGLVETPSDLGHSGAPPTHPELLDWMASDFIRSGWSMKGMHRSIVLSATYRQSSRGVPEGKAKDGDSRLLWRYPSRRLDAETLRDSIVAVSGRLNLKVGGPGFDLFTARGGLTGFPPIEAFGEDGRRRMIYAHKIRREREAVFGAFDCPDAGQSTARRRQSTTPMQALNLFNSRFVVDEANALAARVHKEVGSDIHSQIRRAYQLALSRDPEPNELPDAESVVREHGLSTLCRVLFNCNEFVFLP